MEEEVTLGEIIGADGVFIDGDWVESKDQDPQGDVRLIQLADIGDGTFLNKSARFLTKEKAKALNCTFLEPGDLLVARLPDPIGRSCIFPGLDMPCVTVVDICVVRPDKARVNSHWLKFMVNSHGFRKAINKFVTGTTRKRISRRNLGQLKFRLPPIEHQIRVAAILSKVETLTHQRKESLRLLDEFLKSTFLEMFGDPVRNEKGWDKKKLEDLVAEDCPITYGIVQPGEEVPSGIPIVRPVDLVETTIVRDALKRIDPKVSAKFKRTILKGNEILICVRGTTGKLAFATSQLKGCNVTRGITPIWFPDSYNSVFAFSLLDFPTINMEIQKLTYGATLKQINLRDLREIMLINPPIDLQRKYASIFATVDSIRTQYQSSLKQLTNLFGSLNQRAFRYPTNSKSLPIRIKAQTHLEHEQSA